MEMQGLCDAPEPACKQLLHDSEALNARMIEEMKRQTDNCDDQEAIRRNPVAPSQRFDQPSLPGRFPMRLARVSICPCELEPRLFRVILQPSKSKSPGERSGTFAAFNFRPKDH